MRITLKNYGLRDAEWEPRGLCLLVGDHGSGKSLLLDAVSFLQGFARGTAFDALRGRGHVFPVEGEPTVVRVSDGDWCWTVTLTPVSFDEHTVVPVVDLTETVTLAGTRLAGGEWERWPAESVGSGVNGHAPDAVEATFCAPAASPFLEHVVHGWLTTNRGHLVERLSAAAREAFPRLGQKPLGGAMIPDPTTGSRGVRDALGALVAVLDAPQNALVPIDGKLDGLHPRAARVILERIRERGDLDVVIATCSPALVSEFARAPGAVFVAHERDGSFPVPLDRARDPELLARALGGLSECGDSGAWTAARAALPSALGVVS